MNAAETNIIVVGIWHNDSTTGVGLFCDGCGTFLATDDGQDDWDALSLSQIQEMIENHHH